MAEQRVYARLNGDRGGAVQGPVFAGSFRQIGRGRAAVLLGALVAVLATLALIMSARPGVGPASVASEEVAPLTGIGAGPAGARRASAGEVRAYLNDVFDRLDRDGSGAVERGEAPRRQVISARLRDGSIRTLPLDQAEWFARGDGDRDGRVTRTEYFARLLPPVQAIYGVPRGWPDER